MGMTNKLTPEDFQWAAKELGCEVAAILAVDRVESRGAGFIPGTTEPTILFERHVFHRLTNGVFSTPDNVNISNKVPGGYKGGIAEHSRLQAAVALGKGREKSYADWVRVQALKSCSWGRFQIMGFNHELAGYSDLQDFINAMYKDERKQLEAFVAFIKNTGLVRYLNSKDWAGFALRYNGKEYARNQYDVKLRDAYNYFKRQEAEAAKAKKDED